MSSIKSLKTDNGSAAISQLYVLSIGVCFKLTPSADYTAVDDLALVLALSCQQSREKGRRKRRERKERGLATLHSMQQSD